MHIRILFFSALLWSLSFGFGEQPKVPGIVANPGLYKTFTLDLGKDQYLKTITLDQTQPAETITLSSDGLDWHNAMMAAVSTSNPFSYNSTSENARYVKITNTTTINCNELRIIPDTAFRAQFVSINATPALDSCALYIKTEGRAYIQILYGLNYDYLYKKILLGSYSSMGIANEDTISLTNLQPETTYRYQIRLRDLNNNEINSYYFTFTTLPRIK